MTGDGTVIASLAAGVAHDAAGNANDASTSTDNTVTYDVTPPTVTINQAAGQADPTNASPINFTVVFSEAVTDFATGDVTLGGTAGARPRPSRSTGSGTTYNVAVSGMTGNGTVIATIAAGVAHDAAGNANTASTSTDNTVTYDITAPTVTINQAAGQADPTNASPINFTVVFSESVTDFTAGDVTLSGTAAGNADGDGDRQRHDLQRGRQRHDRQRNGDCQHCRRSGPRRGAATPSTASTSTDNTRHLRRHDADGDDQPGDGPEGSDAAVRPSTSRWSSASRSTDFTTGDVTLSGTAGRYDRDRDPVGADGTTYNVAVTRHDRRRNGDRHHRRRSSPRRGRQCQRGLDQHRQQRDLPGPADAQSRGRRRSRGAKGRQAARLREPGHHLGGIERIRHRLADHHRRWKNDEVDLRPLQRIVLFLPDRNVGRRRPHLRDSGDRLQGHQLERHRHVHHRGAGPADHHQRGGRPSRTRRRTACSKSNELAQLTWAATSPNKIVSQTVTVDGFAASKVHGPFSGRFYSCSLGRWGTGTHTYVIHATDSKGVSSNVTGTFKVAGLAGPTITNVVVAEAAAPKNNILESNEPSRSRGPHRARAAFASQTVSVDGKTMRTISGPFSGSYYSCPIGTWPAGSHTYTIRSTDSRGVVSSKTGTFNVAAALTVDASAAPQRLGRVADRCPTCADRRRRPCSGWNRNSAARSRRPWPA